MKRNMMFLLVFFSVTNSHSQVLTGLDILQKNNFEEVKGKKVGLITNHSALNVKGKSALSVFYDSQQIELKAIFSPEHGLKGIREGGKIIENSKYGTKKIPVFSLYGKTKRPTTKMLSGIDTLVFDIQDIGARFYTYLTTMGYAMEEAAKNNIEFIVLDRPNPIGGKIIEGPVLEKGIKAFTAYYGVPVRHGFTAGEMALFHKEKKNLSNLKLKIVKMRNWKRNMFFRETGLPWINPSPNIRNFEAELLYPGLGCFEATNVSVGRGTNSPFLWFGAPWMKARKIVKKLNKAKLRGVKFQFEERVPSENMYKNKICRGIKIKVKDGKKVNSFAVFLHAAYWLLNYNEKEFELRKQELIKMVGRCAISDMIIGGEKPQKTLGEINKINFTFMKEREKYFLYK